MEFTGCLALKNTALGDVIGSNCTPKAYRSNGSCVLLAQWMMDRIDRSILFKDFIS